MASGCMSRTAFGKTLAEQGVWEERIADARIDIEMTRLLCLKAADMMDKAGNKAAQARDRDDQGRRRRNMALKIIDDAIQAHGGGGRVGGFRAGASLCRRSARCGSPTVRTRSTAAPSPGSSTRSIDERAGGSTRPRSARGWRRMSRGSSGPFTLTKFSSGQSNPTYRITAASGEYVLRRKPFGPLLPSAHAVDREYRLLVGASPARFPGAGAARLVRRPEVIGAIFYVMEVAKGRPYAERRAARLRCRPRAGACTSSWSTRSPSFTASTPSRPGSRDFGKAGQLFRAPGGALDPAVSRLADRLYPRDGAADRVPAGDLAGAVAYLDRPRRLSHRQCDVRRRRNAHGGARLGAGDARRSARRFLLSGDAVGDAGRRRRRARRARPGRRSASRRSRRSSQRYSERSGVPVAASSTGISPTICSASPGSSRASRNG